MHTLDRFIRSSLLLIPNYGISRFLTFVLTLVFFVTVNAQKVFSLPNPDNVYWVILAGGSGTRLWPLSRADKPKQFLNVTQDNLIQQSVNRLISYPEFSKTHVYLGTGSTHRQQVAELQERGLEIEGIIEEPGRRDTGPAILLATLTILKQDPQAYIMFLPADPYIPEDDYEAFGSYLVDAMNALQTADKVLLLGKKPEFAASGYGYIEYKESSAVQGVPTQEIVKFHEKPRQETAEEYVQKPNMLWNMGMFAGKAATFAGLFEKYANTMYEGVVNYMAGKSPYSAVEKKSVDFAIMEPSSQNGELVVLPVDKIEWHDVGNVDVYLGIRNAYLRKNGLNLPKIIEEEASKNKAYVANQDKLVAFVGVEGLCIVDTNDVLLVVKCVEAEKVKKAVETMSKEEKIYKPFL